MKRLMILHFLLLFGSVLTVPAADQTALVEELDVHQLTYPESERLFAGAMYVPESGTGAFYSSRLKDRATAGQPMDLAFTFGNGGETTIQSIRVQLTIDNFNTISNSVENLRLAPGEIVNITVPALWTPPQAGESYLLDFSVVEINGESGMSSTLRKEVLGVLGYSAPKHVMIEEFTGTWCGWCTDGGYILNKLLEANPHANAAALHVGVEGFPDPMQIPAGFELSETYHTAFPHAMFDRLRLHGVTIPVTRTVWFESYSTAYNEPAVLSVDVESFLEANSRKLNITSVVKFVDFVGQADLRINIYVIEDGITSSEEGYAQQNYLSNNDDYKDSPFFNEPPLIEDYVHDHVVRASLTGAWGDKLEGSFFAGASVSAEHSFDIPEDMNIDNMSVIAFVTHFDSEVSYRPVLNSGHSKIQQSPSTDVLTAEESLEIVGSPNPNPANDICFLQVNIREQSPLRADLYSLQGERLLQLKDVTAMPGLHSIAVPTAGYSDGAYLLHIQVGDKIYRRRLLVQH